MWRFFAMVLAVISGGRQCSLAAEVMPPNVVFIVSDDHGWTDYSFLGHKQVETPHLDRLAAQSLVFRRGYVPSSLCCPSLASLITGRYPHQHKITGNDPPELNGAGVEKAAKDKAFRDGREVMNRNLETVATLPNLLTQRGYLSLQTGKWWQGDFRRGGFTHGMTKGQRHGDEGLDIGRKTMQPIGDFLTAAREQKRPFFVWYAPMMPHDPHTPPQRLLDKYKAKTDSLPVAKYWAMIEWFDETCGDLLKRLDEQGLAENTIVVYVTDNGWIQKHDGNGFAPKNKLSPYNFGVQTPIMIRWPGRVSPKMSEELASSLDIVPTILDAVGISRPDGLPGLNLLDEQVVSRRKTVFGECYTHTLLDLHDPAKNLLWRWTVEGRWRLIVPRTHQATGALAEIPEDTRLTSELRRTLTAAKPELYDILADPLEEKNLADEHPDVVAGLLAKLNAWWTPVIRELK